MDAEHLQVRVRGLLADICRGAHNAPDCDDVGHLPAYTGNVTVTSSSGFVRSDDEPAIFLRAAILRCVWADDDRADEGASE